MRVPLQVVVAGNTDLVADLQGCRELTLGQEQFLGFNAGRRGRLAQVQWALAVSNTVAEGKQRLAPVDVMPTEPHVKRHAADIQPGEHKGVEQLTGSLVVTLYIAGKLSVGIGWWNTQRVVVFDVFVVGKVVPARRRNAKAMGFPIDKINLGQDVDPICDHFPLVTVQR
ncbi:hypothetical protein D3C76_1093480 [compost metagenome]